MAVYPMVGKFPVPEKAMIRITDPDALGFFEQMEGQGWRRDQEQHPDPRHGFYAFLRAFQSITDPTGHFIHIDGNPAIYGDYNRYYVKDDTGEVFFSESHAKHDLLGGPETTIAKAKALGFTML